MKSFFGISASKLLMIVLGFSVLLYLRGITGGFVWDDRLFFVDNDILPHLRPWDLGHILFKPVTYWGDYVPVTNFLFVLEHWLFGKSTLGYHLVSLVLYIASGVMAYLLALELFRRRAIASISAEHAALATTALFMFHPAHVEVVAYITGQKDLLYGLFSLCALYAVTLASRGRGMALVPGVVFYYLAFLSKAMAVSTAVFIPVLWLLVLRADGQGVRKPFFVWLGVNLPVVGWIGYTLFSGGGLFSLLASSPERIIRGLKILGAHTSNALIPWPLNFGYPFDASDAIDINFFMGAMIVLILCIFLFKRPRSLMTLGFAMYLIYLLPIMQIVVQISNAMIFDRYLYIAVFGMALVVVEAGALYAYSPSVKNILVKKIVACSFSVLLLLYATATFSYVPKFKSDVASLGHAYRTFPKWDRAAFDYVYALVEAGKLKEALEITKSERTFNSPSWVRDYFKGWILVESGQPDASLMPLVSASYACSQGGFFPFPDVHLARAYVMKGQPAKARPLLRRVMKHRQWNPLEYYKAKLLMDELNKGGTR